LIHITQDETSDGTPNHKYLIYSFWKPSGYQIEG